MDFWAFFGLSICVLSRTNKARGPLVCALWTGRAFQWLFRTKQVLEVRDSNRNALLKVSPSYADCFLTFSTGTLNVLLRTKSIASVDTQVWSKSGPQGPGWRKAFIDFSPVGPFQVNSLWWLRPLYGAAERRTAVKTSDELSSSCVFCTAVTEASPSRSSKWDILSSWNVFHHSVTWPEDVTRSSPGSSRRTWSGAPFTLSAKCWSQVEEHVAHRLKESPSLCGHLQWFSEETRLWPQSFPSCHFICHYMQHKRSCIWKEDEIFVLEITDKVFSKINSLSHFHINKITKLSPQILFLWMEQKKQPKQAEGQAVRVPPPLLCGPTSFCSSDKSSIQLSLMERRRPGQRCQSQILTVAAALTESYSDVHLDASQGLAAASSDVVNHRRPKWRRQSRNCCPALQQSAVRTHWPHSVSSWRKWCGSHARGGAFVWGLCVDTSLKSLWLFGSCVRTHFLSCWDLASWAGWVSPALRLDAMLSPSVMFPYFPRALCLAVWMRLSLYT